MSAGWPGEKQVAGGAWGLKVAVLTGGAFARPLKFEKVWTSIHSCVGHWLLSQVIRWQTSALKSALVLAALVWNSPVRIRRDADMVAPSSVETTSSTRA